MRLLPFLPADGLEQAHRALAAHEFPRRFIELEDRHRAAGGDWQFLLSENALADQLINPLAEVGLVNALEQAVSGQLFVPALADALGKHAASAEFLNDSVVGYSPAEHAERWYVYGSSSVNESPVRHAERGAWFGIVGLICVFVNVC